MVSEPKGIIYIPVWVDDGVVKALVDNSGNMRITIARSEVTVKTKIEGQDETLPVEEQSPLTSIQAQMYGDMADTWYKVRVSSGRSLHTYITGQAGDLEITQLDPSDMLVAGHGYDGTTWRKNAQLWGYSDRIATRTVKLTAATGTNYISLGTVPAGEVWVIEAMAAKNVNNNPSSILWGVHNGTTWLYFEQQGAPGVDTWAKWSGVFRLKEGDSVGCQMNGCVAADDLYCNYNGYIMNVDM